MAIEIERKFLVKGDYKSEATSHSLYRQGYLSSNPDCSIRIRIAGEKGYITIKGKSNEKGMSRYEWEKEIPKHEADELFRFCISGIIEKVRYLVPFDGFIFEVDEFHGSNEGLTIAEIELKSEEEKFSNPSWLGKEVTGIRKYYNSSLLKEPFSLWPNE